MKPEAGPVRSGAVRVACVACAGVFLLALVYGCGTDRTDEGLAELLARGRAAEAADNFGAAESAYREATERYPDDARGWSHLGEFLRFYAHDPEGAERACRLALAAPVRDALSQAFAWRALGELAAARGDGEGAEAAFAASLAAQPLADTHRSLAHHLGMRGEFATAARHAQAAVALQPGDPIALLLYAAHLERAGRHEEGRQAFRRALALAGCDEQGRHEKPVHCCVFYNAAGYLAVCRDRAGMRTMLEAFFRTPNHRHLPRAHILADPDFAPYAHDQALRELLDRHLPERH